MCDPTYLADAKNRHRQEIVDNLIGKGVTVSDCGGDAEAPVWWRSPYLVLPISAHYDSSNNDPVSYGAECLAESVGCDSGMFVFLEMNDDMPSGVAAAIHNVIDRRIGSVIEIPPGKYRLYLEQCEGYAEARLASLYRNIVAVWTPL
ncbi:MAG TPA: hypothetical protein VG711_03050 [Phycisphaerales bacterium]|nr:hypothetical protein [Phycisphaerales bacterium]